MTYERFVVTSTLYYQQNKDSLRYGQAVFGALEAVRPDISEVLRGTDLDPFYKDYVSDEVWEFIVSKW